MRDEDDDVDDGVHGEAPAEAAARADGEPARQPAAAAWRFGANGMNPNDRRRLQWDAQAGGSPPRRRDPSSTLGVTAGRAVRREDDFYMLLEQYGIQRRPHPCGT